MLVCPLLHLFLAIFYCQHTVPFYRVPSHQLHLLLNKFSLLLSFGVTLMRIFLYSEKLYRSQRVIIISHYNSLFSLPLTTFKRTILKHPKSELLKLISMFPCYMELQKQQSLYTLFNLPLSNFYSDVVLTHFVICVTFCNNCYIV